MAEEVVVKTKKPAFSAEQKKQAVKMVEGGKTIKEVAEHFKTTPVTVGRWIKPAEPKEPRKKAVKRGGRAVEALKAEIAELESQLSALKSALKVLQK